MLQNVRKFLPCAVPHVGRGTERGSRLLKDKDAATCRINQNVLLNTPNFLPCS